MQRVMWTDPLVRKPGMSLAEYSRYYLDVHGAIALAGGLSQIRRYVQNHRIDQLPPVLERIGLGDNGIDSVAQIWLDNQAALLEMIATPGAQALLEDERNFMDLDRPRAPVFLIESVIEGPPRGAQPDGLKLLVFARRQLTLSVGAFRERWLTAVDAGSARAVGATRHIVSLAAGDFRYDDAAVERIADPRGAIDGVREIWFPSIDAMTASNIDAWQRLIYPAGVDPARTQTVLVREHVLIAGAQ